MAETEPITVEFRADTADLTAGIKQSDAALRDFGLTASHTNRVLGDSVHTSQGLFRSFVMMRVALSATEHTMKELGISSDATNKIFGIMNTVMDVGITIMAIYRAAKIAQGLSHWFAARAALAESAAEAGTVTFGAAIPIVAAMGLAVFAAIEAATLKLAKGGIVMPRAGGTHAILGEAGVPEVVIPLDRYGIGAGSSSMTVNMNVYSNDPDMIGRVLARKIEQMKAAGF